MFRFSIHKMVRNRWLAFCLFIGYLLAVSIVCSMPVYSHAILGRMLTKDLEQIQTSSGQYPGRVTASTNLYVGGAPESAKRENYVKYDDQYHQLLKQLGVTVLSDTVYTAVDNMQIVRGGTAKEDIKQEASIGQLGACKEFFDHVTLIEGEWPSASAQEGVLEAAVSEEAARNLGVSLGSTYDIYKYNHDVSSGTTTYNPVCTVTITAVYQIKDEGDIFWCIPWSTFSGSIMLEPEVFNEQFINSEEPLFDTVQWATALDYREMTPENCGEIAGVVAHYEDGQVFSPTLKTAFSDILEEYEGRQRELKATLWIIEVPILLMLLFYIMMVSRLILEHEKNEIAVLRSRGASKFQILCTYFYQSLLLAAAAFLAGPWLSLPFCRMIGASSGFMEFVNRKALEVSIPGETWWYAAATAAALVLSMILAVLFNKEMSIVSFKRKKSGKAKAPLWQKLFLDAVCLVVSGYALYNFQNRLEVIRQTGATASDVPIDFMMYGSSTLFILGGTLLFLRIFPLLVRIIYKIGERFWGPVLYLSLLNISRGSRRNQMISLFLIFTLSMGIFNSVAVRTLNQNDEDRIRYGIGADVVLTEAWPSTGGTSVLGSGTVIGETQGGTEESTVYYTEPMFSRYENMETVESAARVLKWEKDVSLSGNQKQISNITLMGIVPDEFGMTCYMKNGLLPHHINEYLNLLAMDPRALLLSNQAMEENDLKPGDTVYLSIGDNKDSVQFVIYAGIDYFPSFNPVGTTDQTPVLAVGNLVYLQQETKLEPYEVWLKKASGVTSAELYEELESLEIPLKELEDTQSELTTMKNDPMTQGINGFFTLSFLVTMLITFTGFFIYWILAIKGRLLQFGILRSMGLPRLSVVMVVFWEQLLVSVTAILAGLGLGTLTAILFAPILECNVDAAEQILPFTVSASPVDYLRIVILVSLMLLLAVVVLGRMIFKLHANEALKLGED